MCIRDRAYIKTESDVLKFVTALIANTKGDGKEGDEFWTKAETLLYCACLLYTSLGIAATTLEGVLAVKGHGTPGHAGH